MTTLTPQTAAIGFEASADARAGAPRWAKRWLVAAGVYNLAWGAAVIAFPMLLFDLTGMDRPTYPQIWQCVGMIVGVYGIGYLAASLDPRRHWPIVLVGLLGKIFGPIGFAGALANGDFPPAFGLTILTNDLIWWAPFSIMLWDAWKANSAPADASTPTLEAAMDELRDGDGTSLGELSESGPVLAVFQRHSGCTFCKKSMAELRGAHPMLRDRGVRLAIVTMTPAEQIGTYAESSGLVGDGVSWISDPSARGYRAFGLGRGTFGQLFGPAVWRRGLAAPLRGHGVGRLVGDGFQMPGAFLIEGRRIVAASRASHAGDTADAEAMTCRLPGEAKSA